MRPLLSSLTNYSTTIVKIIKRIYSSVLYSILYDLVCQEKHFWQRWTKPTNQRKSNDQCCHVTVTKWPKTAWKDKPGISKLLHCWNDKLPSTRKTYIHTYLAGSRGFCALVFEELLTHTTDKIHFGHPKEVLNTRS